MSACRRHRKQVRAALGPARVPGRRISASWEQCWKKLQLLALCCKISVLCRDAKELIHRSKLTSLN